MTAAAIADDLFLADVDWTVIAAAAVTGVTAITVGLIGLFGARLSATVGQRQVEAENERLREEHREAHLRRRQELYLRLLSADRQLIARVNSGERLERSQTHALYESIAESASAAVLFGTKYVGRRALDYQRVVGQVFRDASGPNEDFDVTTRALFRETSSSWAKTRQALIDAMREDVSADQLALDAGDGRERPKLDLQSE
jgi:hypothetical protein